MRRKRITITVSEKTLAELDFLAAPYSSRSIQVEIAVGTIIEMRKTMRQANGQPPDVIPGLNPKRRI